MLPSCELYQPSSPVSNLNEHTTTQRSTGPFWRNPFHTIEVLRWDQRLAVESPEGSLPSPLLSGRELDGNLEKALSELLGSKLIRWSFRPSSSLFPNIIRLFEDKLRCKSNDSPFPPTPCEDPRPVSRYPPLRYNGCSPNSWRKPAPLMKNGYWSLRYPSFRPCTKNDLFCRAPLLQPLGQRHTADKAVSSSSENSRPPVVRVLDAEVMMAMNS